jgi:hypothetical protein
MRRLPRYLTAAAMAALAGCGSSNTATTSPAISRCTTAQLEASLGEPRGTGGTTTDYPLNLRNTSTSTCTIQGYAGVSFVAGDDNNQIGHAASWDTGSAPTIMLSHGQTASATLGIVDPANLPPDCDPTPPTGLRVSPPDQTASLVIDPAGIACSNPKYTTVHVGPFQSA